MNKHTFDFLKFGDYIKIDHMMYIRVYILCVVKDNISKVLVDLQSCTGPALP